MYAIIRTGGKQYRVAKDDVLAIERVAGDVGSKLRFDDVLLMGEEGKAPTIGAPCIKGAHVSGEVVEQKKADKVNVIKFNRRKKYRRIKGHRQEQSLVRITDIKKASTAKKADASETKD